MLRLDPSHEADEFLYDEAKKAVRDSQFRLPSEAEYEWIAREGDTVSFACNLDKRYPGTGFFSTLDLENAFGIRRLLSPQWVADAWHETYVAAPSDSRAWTEAGRAGGVLRGALELDPEDTFGVALCLAAYRHYDFADYITLRIARSL